MDLLARVRRTIRTQGLAVPGTRVVAAVSGGADSVALLHLLRELRDAGELILAGVAHFNHQIRDTADQDERFCADLAARLDLPFLAGRGDVPQRARDARWSIERAAREARHEFLGDAADQFGAEAIALGHSRDDQAETFLLRLIRGAGSRGLAAMYPRNGRVIRPLLDCSRDELRHYLSTRGIPHREDVTNEDVAIPRNRVRKELLPLLIERFNPAVVERLADAADVARDEHGYLKGVADEWLAAHGRQTPGEWLLDRGALSAAPRAIARLAVWRALSEAAGAAPAYDEVERVLEFAHGRCGPFDASRQRVQLIGGDVVLRARARSERGRPRLQPGSNDFGYALSIPGEVQLVEAGCAVSAEVAAVPAEVPGSRTMDWTTVPFDKTTGGLHVRNRRPGDRFWPAGAPGRRKLQDFLVDRKVIRERRDRIPIVVDADDRIIWVAGYGVDEAFRVKDPAQAVIILRLKGLGGSD